MVEEVRPLTLFRCENQGFRGSGNNIALQLPVVSVVDHRVLALHFNHTHMTLRKFEHCIRTLGMSFHLLACTGHFQCVTAGLSHFGSDVKGQRAPCICNRLHLCIFSGTGAFTDPCTLP